MKNKNTGRKYYGKIKNHKQLHDIFKLYMTHTNGFEMDHKFKYWCFNYLQRAYYYGEGY